MGAIELALKHLAELTQKLTVEHSEEAMQFSQAVNSLADAADKLSGLGSLFDLKATNPITTAGEHLEGLRSVISELPLRDRNTVIAHLHELLRQAEAS